MTAPASQTSSPEAREGLVGTWNLVSCLMEDLNTKERVPVWGERPNGRLVLTDNGQWLVVQTAEGRKAPQTNDDRSAAFRSMLAYGGRYRAEGRTITINVDIAWDESWTGTQQVRFYSVEGDLLHIEAAPQRYANLGDKLMRGILTWQRVE